MEDICFTYRFRLPTATSYTPPKWLALGELWCHSIHCGAISSSISNVNLCQTSFKSLDAQTKLKWKAARNAFILRSIHISKCIALIVYTTMYTFIDFDVRKLEAFIWNGPHKTAPIFSKTDAGRIRSERRSAHYLNRGLSTHSNTKNAPPDTFFYPPWANVPVYELTNTGK